VKVGPTSTIRVRHNTYSVHSRLIGERVEIRLYAERLEVWYAQKKVDTLPRLRGRCGHHIEYRHIIDYLVRKPGAFENYRYRQDLFPTHRFRVAYDQLTRRLNGRSSKEYLRILELAARENEAAVDEALGYLLDTDRPISTRAVSQRLGSAEAREAPRDVVIDEVELSAYDALLEGGRPGAC
jgi:hypothetical protein